MTKFIQFSFAKILAAASLNLLLSTHSFADHGILDDALDQYLPEELQWHGFISQGFALTDHNNFLGSSKDGSFDYNELGLGASYSPISQVQFSLQGLYRTTGTSTKDEFVLDYGVLDWRAIDNFEYGAGIRAGRIKNGYGFYNETRDIGSTTPSVLLPQSTYIDYLRSLVHSSDSIGLYGHKALGSGTVSFNISTGKPILDDYSRESLFGSTSGRLDNDKFSVGRVSYESDSGMWRFAISHGELTTDYTPPVIGLLQAGAMSIRQTLVSAELNWENWQIITEHQKRNIAARGILAGLTQVTNGESYYYQLGFSFSEQIKAYVRRDVIYRMKNSKDGSEWLAGEVIPGNRTQAEGFAKDFTLGVRYLPDSQWIIGAEVHRINGTYWLPDVENEDKQAQEQLWNLFLLKAEYRF